MLPRGGLIVASVGAPGGANIFLRRMSSRFGRRIFMGTAPR